MGPDATYDAIKSFFEKEVSPAAEQLKAKLTTQHGSGRGVPPRSSPGGPSRPRLLYLDDEDISILTEREAKAHFSHSLQAPAKRPRVVKTSPQPSPVVEDLVQYATMPERRAEGPVRNVTVTSEPANGVAEVIPSNEMSHPEASSNSMAQSNAYHATAEDPGPGNKRPYSVIDDTVEAQPSHSARSTPSPASRLQSFGYVTKQGNYRCALCLSQLPSQEDLERHEALSKEHLRNLKSAFKVTKGRQKLAQVTTATCNGPHQSTPAPTQPLAVNGFIPVNARAKTVTLDPPSNNASGQQESPLDTIEVCRRSPGSAAIPDHRDIESTTSTQQLDVNGPLDKDKQRASPPPSPPSPPPLPRANPPPKTPSEPPTSTQARSTTEQTEIGTLNTPNTHIPLLQGEVPASPIFSAQQLAEITTTTEVMVQLIRCVQREAIKQANSSSETASVSASASAAEANSQMNRGVGSETAEGSRSKAGVGEMDVGLQGGEVRREKKKAKAKDTGDDAYSILLD